MPHTTDLAKALERDLVILSGISQVFVEIEANSVAGKIATKGQVQLGLAGSDQKAVLNAGPDTISIIYLYPEDKRPRRLCIRRKGKRASVREQVSRDDVCVPSEIQVGG
jgi:hypothetical protein